MTDFAKKARTQIREKNFVAVRALDYLVCGAVNEPHLPADGTIPCQFFCVRCQGGANGDTTKGWSENAKNALLEALSWWKILAWFYHDGANQHYFQHEAACGAERLFECLWRAQATRAMFSHAGTQSFCCFEAHTCKRRASATGHFSACLG